MSWTYQQSTGIISRDGKPLAKGYSGAPGHVNNPASQHIRMFGPIPRGWWKIADPIRHPKLGAVAMRLAPVGHDAFGRTSFLIHGDNSRRNRTASQGCIILDLLARQIIAKSGDKDLEVIE